MPQQQLEQTTPITMRQLKDLSGAAGPCITVLFPLHREDARQATAAAKDAIRAVEQRLEERNLERKLFDALMEPLRDLPDEIEAAPGNSVVILRSPDLFQKYFVPQTLEESVTVGGHFHLLPLFPVLSESRPFYVLALSQKHIRLLRCTNTTSEEVELPASMPRTLDDFIQSDKPDHMLDNASASGPGTGSMTRVMFGTGAESERKGEHLLHFYKVVDRAITELLKADTAPLVIAGVDYELPVYRSVSAFPRLVEDAVHGAPDGLKGGELHKRALEAVAGYWSKESVDALAMYEQFGGSERTSGSLKEIVKAAHDGRVLHLFVAEGIHYMGNFDDATHKVTAHREEQPGDEDLINAAAVETLRHAGNVFVLPTKQIPHGSQMAAVMRY